MIKLDWIIILYIICFSKFPTILNFYQGWEIIELSYKEVQMLYLQIKYLYHTFNIGSLLNGIISMMQILEEEKKYVTKKDTM